MEPGANTRAETYERQREIVRSVLEAKPPTCTLGEAARLFEAAVGPDFFEASLRILVPLLESPTSARSFQGSVPDQLAASNADDGLPSPASTYAAYIIASHYHDAVNTVDLAVYQALLIRAFGLEREAYTHPAALADRVPPQNERDRQARALYPLYRFYHQPLRRPNLQEQKDHLILVREAGLRDLQDFLQSFTTPGAMATLVQYGSETLTLTLKKLASGQALDAQVLAKLGDIEASQALFEVVVAVYKGVVEPGSTETAQVCATLHHRVVPALLDSVLARLNDDQVDTGSKVLDEHAIQFAQTALAQCAAQGCVADRMSPCEVQSRVPQLRDFALRKASTCPRAAAMYAQLCS